MSFLTANQVKGLSTAQILNHFGASVSIRVVRSERTNTPLIVFESLSGGVCTALAHKHAFVLSQMQRDWRPMTGNAVKQRNSDLYFATVMLKGLRPSTLREWINKGRMQGFVIDDQVLQPTVKAEIPNPWESTETVATEVVTEIPVEARPVVTHKPFGLPGKQATIKELRSVLRAQGKDTRGNKAALLARL